MLRERAGEKEESRILDLGQELYQYQNCYTVQLQEANHLTSLFPHLTTGRPTDNY